MLVFILDFGEIFCELYYENISLMKKVAVTRPGIEPVTLRSAWSEAAPLTELSGTIWRQCWS